MVAVKSRNLEKFVKPVKPREFCRLWFDADEEMENTWGYRAECVRLLSRVLGVRPETISSKWGEGIEFEKMPEQYEKTLAYANCLREMADAAGKDPALAEIIIERIKRFS
jgi:hypothetical protein